MVSTPHLKKLLGLALAASVPPQQLQAPVPGQPPPQTGAPACVSGLQIFVLRGTNETESLTGLIGPLAYNIADKINGSAVTAVDYPATYTNPFYNDSVTTGTAMLKELVEGYTSSCPQGKMALLGYSQGAHAVLDLLCGAGISGLMATLLKIPQTAPADESLTKNIVAAVAYGDPTHTPNEPYNLGTATGTKGLLARLTPEGCARVAPKIRSWCDVGDPYCAGGRIQPNNTVHSSYPLHYTDAATEFVVESFTNPPAESQPAPSSSSSPSTPAPAPTGTATPKQAGAVRLGGKHAAGAASLAVAGFLLASCLLL